MNPRWLAFVPALVSQLRAHSRQRIGCGVSEVPRKKNPGWVCRLGMCVALLTNRAWNRSSPRQSGASVIAAAHIAQFNTS